MENVRIIKIDDLPYKKLLPLLTESQNEGFHLINKLITDYKNGTNRFDKPGEALFVVYFQNQLVAIGGLNLDPYLFDQKTGRIRHIYVLNQFRRSGIGSFLVKHIIQEAYLHFDLLTLRTLTETGISFYEKLGFHKCTKLNGTTHFFDLK